MSNVKSFNEVAAEMSAGRKNPGIVRDWRELIPSNSRWFPGCPGQPECKTCEGTGYLRIGNLPVGHPYFGQIVLCDCVRFR